MCQWLIDRLETQPGWIDDIWFTDEAHFHLHGAVNNHNNIFWGTSPPEEISPKELKGEKVTAFVAFNAKHGLLGPYWFQENGRTVTINAERYREIIRAFNHDKRQILNAKQNRQVPFMQDGVPPHRARETIDF